MSRFLREMTKRSQKPSDFMPSEGESGGTTPVVPVYHGGTTERGTTGTTGSRGSGGTTDQPAESVAPKWSRPALSQLNLKIPKQNAEKFRMWCDMNKVSLNEGFLMAVRLLTGGGTTSTTPSGGTTATTVLIDDSLTDDDNIVVFYREITGNKWKPADAATLRDLRTAGVTSDRIECGIVLSVFRCPEKVGSLRYCLGAITEVTDSEMQDTRSYTKRAKVKIAQKRELQKQQKLQLNPTP